MRHRNPVPLAMVERNLRDAPDLRARYVAALISRAARWMRRRLRPTHGAGEAPTAPLAVSPNTR